MKTHPLLFVTTLAVSLALLTSAQATTNSTLTSGTGNWTDTGIWDNGVPTAGTTACMTATLSSDTTIYLTDNSATTGILNMTSGSGTYLLQLRATDTKKLTMDNSGSQAQINIGLDGPINKTVIQNVDIRMTAGGLAITKNNTTGQAISGYLSSEVTGSQTLTLTTKGGGNLNFNSHISDGSGTVNIVVDGQSGRVMLGGTSSFSGGVLLKNGDMSVHATGFGTGLLTLGDSSTTLATRLVAQTGVTVSNDIRVSSSSAYKTSLLYTNTNATTTLSGEIELQKKTYVDVGSGDLYLTLSGNLSGSGNLEFANTVGNIGRFSSLTLSGNNSAHSGGITISTSSVNGASKLILGHANALGTGTLTLGGSGVTTLDSSVANLVLTTNNAIAMNTSFTYNGTGGNNLNLGTGTITFASNKAITVNAGVLTIGGAVVGGAKLEKLGAGVLALNGANTYSSDTDVLAGTLRGTGSVAHDLYVRDTATLEAGDGGIGTFTVGGLTEFHAGSTFKFELNTTAATYDQLITDGLWIDSTVTINFSDLGGSAWGLGTKITVIDNTSGDAISGTFSGYAEGHTFVLGANTFKTTYLGGTGNDFALEVVPEPATVALMLTAFTTLALTRRRRQS